MPRGGMIRARRARMCDVKTSGQCTYVRLERDIAYPVHNGTHTGEMGRAEAREDSSRCDCITACVWRDDLCRPLCAFHRSSMRRLRRCGNPVWRLARASNQCLCAVRSGCWLGCDDCTKASEDAFCSATGIRRMTVFWS